MKPWIWGMSQTCGSLMNCLCWQTHRVVSRLHTSLVSGVACVCTRRVSSWLWKPIRDPVSGQTLTPLKVDRLHVTRSGVAAVLTHLNLRPRYGRAKATGCIIKASVRRSNWILYLSKSTSSVVKVPKSHTWVKTKDILLKYYCSKICPVAVAKTKGNFTR